MLKGTLIDKLHQLDARETELLEDIEKLCEELEHLNKNKNEHRPKTPGSTKLREESGSDLSDTNKDGGKDKLTVSHCLKNPFS